jgi:hypothetical protein
MPSYPATPWLVQPAAPVLVLGTVDQDRFLLSFHGVQESAYLRIPKLMPLLLTISLHGIGLVRQLKLLGLSQTVESKTCVAAPTWSGLEY